MKQLDNSAECPLLVAGREKVPFDLPIGMASNIVFRQLRLLQPID